MVLKFDMTKMVEKITMQVEESQEEFIFETIYPYCENILQMKINKEELKQILLNGMQKQPCEDCISREQTLKAFAEKCAGECACCEYNGSGCDTAENCKLIKSMPSVIPKGVTVTDFADRCRECGAEYEILAKQQPFINKPCISEGVCREDKMQVLDKIRAEIEQLPTKTITNWNGCCPDIDYPEIEYVDKNILLSIIDKYKTESEE